MRCYEAMYSDGNLQVLARKAGPKERFWKRKFTFAYERVIHNIVLVISVTFNFLVSLFAQEPYMKT